MPLDTELGLGQGHIVLDGDPPFPPTGAHQQPPAFRPKSIVVNRSPISATAELLYAFGVRTVWAKINEANVAFAVVFKTL